MMTIEYRSNTDEKVSSGQTPYDTFVGLVPPPPPPPPSALAKIDENLPLLPHQEVHLVLDRINLPEIAARAVPTALMNKENIWTRRVLPHLRIKQTLFDRHYSQSATIVGNRSRRASFSTNLIVGLGGNAFSSLSNTDDGLLSFVLLDATSKMLYDVPMRHLIQLVKKDFDDDATIDHVIRAIDQTQMKSEWLDAVTALNKQFDKRPEDKARVLAHQGSSDGLVLIEQFFVKLVRVPAYELKLIYLKFREEAPSQLERMTKCVNDLLESIETILNNEQLPGILHLLCLIYNSISGKQIAGLHFDSLLSVLATRTAKQNTTIAHLLCHLLEEQYPTLLNLFENAILLKLKDLSAMKYIPIYIDIRLLFKRYQQMNLSLDEFERQRIVFPAHFKTTLNDLEKIFTNLFDAELKIKESEKKLAAYFCLWDLSLETCFSTVGQLVEKLRLAQMQNVEERRRNDLLTRPTTIRSFRSSASVNRFSSSDTNIFRDHLNVPLTPISARQRAKANRIGRDRHSVSSRDVSHFNDAIARKREHSPTSKTIFTKRPFNLLEPYLSTPQTDESDEVFLSETESNKMDCLSTDQSLSMETSKALIPIQYDEQKENHLNEPIQSNSIELSHWYSNLFHHLWHSTLVSLTSKT